MILSIENENILYFGNWTQSPRNFKKKEVKNIVLNLTVVVNREVDFLAL